MTSTAASSDDERDRQPELRRILNSTKPQLQAEWKSVDSSGFEPATRLDLQAALIDRLYLCTTKSGQRQTKDALLGPEQDFTAVLPSPSAITSEPAPQSSASSQTQLDQIERQMACHADQLEQLDRTNRKLNLVLYNIAENPCDTKDRDACARDVEANPLLEKLIWSNQQSTMTSGLIEFQRIGRISASKQKARPVRFRFDTDRAKHMFLAHAQELRQAGIRVDDDLTRHQQQERRSLDSDFKALKAKGYQPFWRGSQLKYHSSMGLCSCSKDQANKVSPA